ncbi:hypothetical protein AB0M57_20475 [Streptomyces sp. NPDC051597]
MYVRDAGAFGLARRGREPHMAPPKQRPGARSRFEAGLRAARLGSV